MCWKCCCTITYTRQSSVMRFYIFKLFYLHIKVDTSGLLLCIFIPFQIIFSVIWPFLLLFLLPFQACGIAIIWPDIAVYFWHTITLILCLLHFMLTKPVTGRNTTLTFQPFIYFRVVSRGVLTEYFALCPFSFNLTCF